MLRELEKIMSQNSVFYFLSVQGTDLLPKREIITFSTLSFKTLSIFL